MKKFLFVNAAVVVLLASSLGVYFSFSKTSAKEVNELISFSDYKDLVLEVEVHRSARLVNYDEFHKMSQKTGTIILDTRSDEMYAKKHLKGAVHLNFSDFSQESLANIIPSTTTRILIYCNNNFLDDQKYFFSKLYIPPTTDKTKITLALNISTYINLYGYGYKNVYELSELLSINDSRLEFEGTEVASHP